MLIYSVHLLSEGTDRKFASFDCYWQATNTAAELLNEYQLPLDARAEIRATDVSSI